jgi:hypothetical protein
MLEQLIDSARRLWPGINSEAKGLLLLQSVHSAEDTVVTLGFTANRKFKLSEVRQRCQVTRIVLRVDPGLLYWS